MEIVKFPTKLSMPIISEHCNFFAQCKKASKTFNDPLIKKPIVPTHFEALRASIELSETVSVCLLRNP
jgi:hypothetical protein